MTAKVAFSAGTIHDKYEITKPGGAFYIFPRAPGGKGEDFVAKAIENNLLTVPGNIFSQRDTHFRISYAASTAELELACERIHDFCAALT